ncbi:sigma-70 family RNA polymerase sigma factor [Virgibacillus salexigens]|uniref:RNA polymerase sigma factor, sigma-70 family n=1 Tax=Virgibacillus massiliensis TaxID=1462526 RepID=A0A024QGX4_9BACI|nr:sigma-70 family RNA polymerase sigma factor [Virgibacillus massiliensis]CDQ41759.1 RNA polymerase sigma factor, sigma-70 family [Virgibacillus massiliensis]
MKLCKTDIELLVKSYQEEKESEALVKQFSNFINKYYKLFTFENIDFSNYDIRYFLSCYLADNVDRKSLRRGKYHSKQDISNAYSVLKYLKQAFKSLDHEDIYHEVLIPFLECANRYKDMNKSFSAYIYEAYKYELIRHIKELMRHQHTSQVMLPNCNESDDELSDNLHIELEEDLILNHPFWLNGINAQYPFSELTREGRLILTKYYLERNTDKQIGRLIGKNRRSVNRSRLRIVRQIQDKISQGEVKWARWSE